MPVVTSSFIAVSKVTLISDEQFSNTCLSSVDSVAPKVTVARFLLFLKAPSPIMATAGSDISVSAALANAHLATAVSAAVPVTAVSLSQPANACSPIVVTLSPKSMDVSPAPVNAPFSIEVTEDGKTMEASDSQPRNTSSPIAVMALPSAKVTEESLSFIKKAPLPIEVTDAGMTTEVNLHPENASAPMVSRFVGSSKAPDSLLSLKAFAPIVVMLAPK